MAKTVGIIAIKGGVGKTTISAALAAELANHKNKKVLVIDANFSSPNLGHHLNILTPKTTIHDVLTGRARTSSAVHQAFNIDVIPGSYVFDKSFNPLKLKDKIKHLEEKYDFIIIDSSPSLNEEILATMLASDILFLVTTPDAPTLSCSLRAAHYAKQRGKPVEGIIINKIRDPGYEFTLKEVQELIDIPVVARIPDEDTPNRALFLRTPLTLYDKKSKFSKEVAALASVLNLEQTKPTFWQKMFSLNLKTEAVNRQLLKDKFYESIFVEK